MIQLAGSAAFVAAAIAFACMGDPITGFLCVVCAMAWGATTSKRRSLRLPRGDILRRL
jgi:hypothetical protein